MDTNVLPLTNRFDVNIADKNFLSLVWWFKKLCLLAISEIWVGARKIIYVSRGEIHEGFFSV
jgi:hypothetical protein